MRVSAFLACLSVVVAGCGQPDPNAPPMLRNPDEYQSTLSQVQSLTQSGFSAMHEGHPLSPKEVADLKEASRLIDGLIAFQPDKYGPYILKGLTLRGLGKMEEAEAAYRQGLALAPPSPAGDDAAAIARIHDEMASLKFDLQQYQEAETHVDQSVTLQPKDPSILVVAASVKVQLKKLKEAESLLQRALAEDPKNERALQLKKLIAPAK